MLVQEVLIYRISRNKSEMFTCCANGKLRLNGSYNRRIRTSSGEVFLSLWRVQCSVCGKTFAPLKQFVELGHYQTKTNELERTLSSKLSQGQIIAVLLRISIPTAR